MNADLTDLTDSYDLVLEFRSAGVMEFWSAGVMDLRITGYAL
jgi:hypothetical protein